MRWLYVDPVGPYPPALRALLKRGASGVYAIRDVESGEVLYVGESHAGRLYHTLTRHLQAWGRSGKRGRGFAGPNDPGTTYRRGDVEVRWRVTSPAAALTGEARWIKTLDPRDNVREPDAPPRRRPDLSGLPSLADLSF